MRIFSDLIEELSTDFLNSRAYLTVSFEHFSVFTLQTQFYHKENIVMFSSRLFLHSTTTRTVYSEHSTPIAVDWQISPDNDELLEILEPPRVPVQETHHKVGFCAFHSLCLDMEPPLKLERLPSPLQELRPLLLIYGITVCPDLLLLWTTHHSPALQVCG